jgi:hypothetical protein
MYAGGPDAEPLLRSYHVDYVLIGPTELAGMQINPAFWLRYPTVAQVGAYRLFQTRFDEGRKPR